MSKRPCGDVGVDGGSDADCLVLLCAHFAHRKGVNVCKMSDLTRDDLIGFLIDDDKIIKMDKYDFLDVKVTDLTGGRCVTLKLPIGEGLSSIFCVKGKIKELFGIEEKCQTLFENANGIIGEMRDSMVLDHKLNGHLLDWDLTLVVSEPRGSFSWDETHIEEVKSTTLVEYMTSGGGSTLSAASLSADQMVPARITYETFRDAAIRITPTMHPSVGYYFGRDGIYTISFELTPSSTVLPTPPLKQGCFIGVRTGTMQYWAVDIFNGSMFLNGSYDERNYEEDFCWPGNVMTVMLDGPDQRLRFFRDGKVLVSVHLHEISLTSIQFMAYIPVVGVGISIVEDPANLPKKVA
jgi:hypothetical protein